jgi:hypothetical protein
VITAGSRKAGCVRVHDIRKAGKTSTNLVEINEHSKSINAVYVSGDRENTVSVMLDNTGPGVTLFYLVASLHEVRSCHLVTLYTSHLHTLY